MDRCLTTPLPHVLNTANGEVGHVIGSSVGKNVEKRETGRGIGCHCDRVFRGDHGDSILALVV